MSTALETRQRLLRQGRLAFAEKGHDGVSLQRDILEPAGVSNGSFYHQFSDKTDLLIAILEAARTRARELRAEALRDEPDDRPTQIRHRVDYWFEMVDGAEDLFRIQLRERNNPDKRVRDLVAAGRTRSSKRLEDRLRTELDLDGDVADPELAAQLIKALIAGVMMNYIDTPKRQRNSERKALTDAMTAFITGGLSGLAEQSERTKPEKAKTARKKVVAS